MAFNLFNKQTNSGQRAFWMDLSSLNKLDSIIDESFQKPIGIFKHSVRCGTSSFVKRQLEKEEGLSAEGLDLYYLDLIQFRDVSNQIEEQFQVKHESPQFLLIKNGKAIYHASHGDIQWATIEQALKK